MNVTLTSLEALILKATLETLPCPDGAALEAFCTIMKDSAEGPQLAVQALAARIHSHNPREAMLALMMLDRCMRRSDTGFHAEVGKFRFLNEMIKLVSPKYFADRTAPEVRTRVLQLLHAWSIEYPKESKFKVAYDMLKNQGVVKETPPPLPPEETAPALKTRSKSAIFEDEEKSKLLQKLLQSKNQEDLQHANRLIKTMVREEERRSEVSSRQHQDVGAALDSAGLLRDMLAAAGSASEDEEQLIAELHASCQRLRPELQHLAAEVPADNLSDILHAINVLDEVFEEYNAFLAEKETKAKSPMLTTEPTNGSLLEFAGVVLTNKDGDNKQKNVIDELGDIFSGQSSSSMADLLKPVTLLSNESVDLLDEVPKEGWNELDSLGEQLMKQSLPENSRRVENFNVKITSKTPMNALEKSPKKFTKLPDNSALLDLDFFTKKSEVKSPPATAINPTSDDVMVDITDAAIVDITDGATSLNSDSPLETILDLGLLDDKKCDNFETRSDSVTGNGSAKKSSEVKPLGDINVSLTSVKPSKVPPKTVFEEEGGLSVVLHFCQDKPRPDVNVIVVSTTNRHSYPIDDYKFQAAVPKGCKLRLLPASGTRLPPSLPFGPPPALAQLMLIARPPGQAAAPLRFVITYSCEDDTCSELGEINDLPLDEI